jgi:hypothetical protein
MLRNTLSVYSLAVKYWLSGDDWRFAVEYAESLVKSWRNLDEKNINNRWSRIHRK